MSSLHRGQELRGRGSECAALDRLLEDVRGGQSRVLVLRGEAGVGKRAGPRAGAPLLERCGT